MSDVLMVHASSSPSTNCNRLRSVLGSITDSSETNRYLVRLEPGRYFCGSVSLGVPPGVTLEGWGKDIVTILGTVDHTLAGVVHLFDRSGLRGLTVDNVLGSASNGGIAVSAWSLGAQVLGVHLEDVSLSAAASSPKPYAVFVSNGHLAVRHAISSDLVRAENGSVVTIDYSTMGAVTHSGGSSISCHFVFWPAFGEMDSSCLLTL